MLKISPNQVTLAIRALFRMDEPQACRCFTVLDHADRGKIFADDLHQPTWAVVAEPTDSSLYFGGNVTAHIIAEVFAILQQEVDVLVGLWLDDPRIALLPPNPDYDGRTYEFYDRPIGKGLDHLINALPADCQVHRLTRDLILRTEWGPGDVASAGGLDAWERTRFGYCVMRGDEMLSEATAGPPAIGLYEPGVFTQPAHRGHGYATVAVAHLIREIEATGHRTYWNCAKQNLASAAVARKLGYRVQKEYRCMMWNKMSDIRGK